LLLGTFLSEIMLLTHFFFLPFLPPLPFLFFPFMSSLPTV